MNREDCLFVDSAMDWLMYKKPSIKESTYCRYEYLIYEYLIKNLNELKLIDLENYNFNEFIEILSLKLAPKSVKDIMVVLKSVLKYSERKYNFDFKLDLISKLKCPENEVKILDDKEFDTLEKFCLDNITTRNTGILICLYTGIRIGELCALNWNSISLQKGEIRVNKTMQRIYTTSHKTFISIDTPKSKKSNRIVPISSKLLKILKKLNKEINFEEEAFFLTGAKDKYIEPRTFQKYFKKVLKENQIQDYKFHILRHTFASRCIQLGMDPKALSEILGHNSVTITLNRYVHSSFKSKKKFLDML